MSEEVPLLKILIITGKKSFLEIQQIAVRVGDEKNLRIECTVQKAPVDVSAFIQQSHVLDICKPLKKDEYDFALIPGFTTWNTADLFDQISFPVYKGTRFSGDLYDLIVHIRDIRLPTQKAADYLLRNHSQQKIDTYITNLKKHYSTTDRQDRSSPILRFITPSGEKVLTGGDFPPLIIAEIVDSPKLTDSEILERVQYFISSGANVIDLGMIFGKTHPNLIKRIIPQIKKSYDILVSVDSVDIDEIISGIESGADIILSIDGWNIDQFLEYVDKNEVKCDLGLVLVPLDGPNHTAIEEPDKKAEFLISLAKKLINQGFKNIFYDALLKSPISPGLMDSLHAYYVLNQHLVSHPKVNFPTFIGLHNVFELVDVDSSGMIGLLSLIALELNCAGVFTTEYSPKTLGSIRDTKRSIDLAYLAKISKSPPTNLGIDAFNVKSKRTSLQCSDEPTSIIDISSNEIPQGELQNFIDKDYEFIHDTTGYFKFYANHSSKLIEALFLPFESIKEQLNLSGPLLLKGKTAESIYKTIDKLGLVREISHAFYVGKELSKAEYALTINAAYFEDTDLE